MAVSEIAGTMQWYIVLCDKSCWVAKRKLNVVG
jgi:hypothetical protein